MDKDILYAEIKSAVKTKMPDARILIYGSYARNEQKKHSDVDIIIISDIPKLTFKERQAVRYAIYDIEIKYGIIMSPKVVTAVEWNSKIISNPFYETVNTEGIEI